MAKPSSTITSGCARRPTRRWSDYLEAEDAYTEAMTAKLKPFQEALYAEMLSHIQQTDMGVPVRRGAYLYYARTVEGKQYPIRCRRKGSMEAPEEVLLDANELGEQHKFVGVGNFVVSDDGNLLAYTVDYTGFRQYSLQVKDLRDGRTLPDTAERVTSVEWAADNRTLFLTTEDAVTKRPDKLWRHSLGDAAFTRSTKRRTNCTISAWQDARQAIPVLGIESKDTSEVRYLPAGRASGAIPGLPAARKAAPLLPRSPRGSFLHPHQQGRPQLRSGHGARRGSTPGELEGVRAAPRRRAHPGPRPVPRFRRGRGKGASDRPHPRLRFPRGNWTAIEFPEPVYAALPAARRNTIPTTTVTATRAWSRRPASTITTCAPHKSTLPQAAGSAGRLRPSQYATERLWATARDGVKVPISIVYRKGFARDGRRALLLYGYGSYGFGTPPTFSGPRLSLLDRGMAYRHRPHPRRRRNGRAVARRRHAHEEEEHLLRFRRLRRIS